MNKWYVIILLILFKFNSYAQDSIVKAEVMILSNGKLQCVERDIVLSPLKAMFTSIPKKYSDSLYFCEGYICDSITNDPQNYALIYINHSKSGFSTDESGKFHIDSLSERDTLNIKSIFHLPKRIPIKDMVKMKLVW
jgi:hypothetical protein